MLVFPVRVWSGTPSRTTHRRVPAVAERISISTPDQSIEVSPCVLKNGYCN